MQQKLDFITRVENELANYEGTLSKDSDQWLELKEKGFISQTGDDETCRAKFVGLQAAVEKAILSMLIDEVISIDDLLHVIHTPMTATPLCFVGKNQDIDPAIVRDPARLATVTQRQLLIMALLKLQAKLVAVYEKGGLEKRSEEGQQRYKELLAQHPNLSELVLEQPLAADQIGATAFVQNNGQTYAYSIGAYQAAEAVKGNKTWSFTLGPVSKENVKTMIAQRKSIFSQAPAFQASPFASLTLK